VRIETNTPKHPVWQTNQSRKQNPPGRATAAQRQPTRRPRAAGDIVGGHRHVAVPTVTRSKYPWPRSTRWQVLRHRGATPRRQLQAPRRASRLSRLVKEDGCTLSVRPDGGEAAQHSSHRAQSPNFTRARQGVGRWSPLRGTIPLVGVPFGLGPCPFQTYGHNWPEYSFAGLPQRSSMKHTILGSQSRVVLSFAAGATTTLWAFGMVTHFTPREAL